MYQKELSNYNSMLTIYPRCRGKWPEIVHRVTPSIDMCGRLAKNHMETLSLSTIHPILEESMPLYPLLLMARLVQPPHILG